MLDYIILGFLIHCEMTGYDIKQHINYSTANFYDASYGSIYPMLKKMEVKKLISSREVIEGGKLKIIYSICEEGRNYFFNWLDQPIKINKTKVDHLVRIFFYDLLPRERATSLIHDFIKTVKANIDALEKIEDVVNEKADFFQKSTLYFGKDYYTFIIQWYQKFLYDINKNV